VREWAYQELENKPVGAFAVSVLLGGLAIAVLDADSSLSTADAVRYFTNRYPQVDNVEVADAFAAKLSEKFKAMYTANPKAASWDAVFSPAESMAILAPAIDASITAEQAQVIVDDLK
jgi:hypothetical protein